MATWPRHMAASMAGPFHRSRPASTTTTTALPASRHLLPVLSYAGLASVTAGALHLVQPVLTGQGVALVGGCVALPAAFVLLQLMLMGGSGVAKRMGGVPADASLTALAHDAAAAVGVPPPGSMGQRPCPPGLATSIAPKACSGLPSRHDGQLHRLLVPEERLYRLFGPFLKWPI